MKQYDSSGGAGGASRSTGADAGDRDPEEIRVEIAQTRTEMSGTIGAIQQRLAPDVLSAQAKDIARDATDQAKTAAQEVLQEAVREVKDAAKEVTEHAVHEVKDAARDVTTGAKDAAWDATVGRAEEAVTTAGETAKGVSSIVIDTIKQNPIPAALAGLSLFWLYKNRAGGQASSNGSTAGAYRTPGSYQAAAAPQAYPIRTGYASQEERDALTSDARSGTSWSGSSGAASRYQSGADGGMIGSAGQMASNAASTAGQIASDAANSAGHLASEAASTAGNVASSAGETALDAGSSIVDLNQQNPVPAALVGIGLGWLYMNRSSGRPDYRAHSGSHYRYGPEAASQANRSGYQSASGDASMVSRATSQVGDLASSAQEHVGEMASSVQDHVSDMTGTVVDQTQRAPGQLQRLVQERPLTAAAVAASLGAAVGLWLPPTQLENHVMGAANAQVMGRAQEVAS